MLDDKYRIERLLATGGMGAVYVGTHTKLRKRVAIKVLSPQHTTPPMIERFRREAITASQIGHEGIAQVTDLGTSLDGEPFLVMEFLDGESLASRLRASGPLSVEDACEIGCAILSPLGAAHRAGIVHRDLKPDNVFLVRQSRGEMVKLLDFGISRAFGVEPEFRLTMTGLVLGTPFYMSPEQARGETAITPAADLYAFGVMLYEMLIGHVPIQADNYNALMYRVTMGEFPRPSVQRPTLPQDLECIILHAMAQAPQDRPASALELERSLLAFCRPAFREQASGRLSTAALSVRTIDYALFTGVTIPDHTEVHLPDEPEPPAAARSITPGASTEPDVPSVAPAGEDLGPTTLALPPRTRRSSIATGAAIVVVGAVAAGMLVIVLTGEPQPAQPPVATLPIPSLPLAPSVVASPAVIAATAPAGEGSARTDDATRDAQTITLRLSIDPPGAAVTLDGARVTGTELVVPRDAARHRLRITAAGYVGYDEVLEFDESQKLVVQLKHSAPAVRVKDRNKERRPDRIESRSPYE